ncbi:alpha-ketoglutarate-dependent dioxygenase alkB isoform X2 [Magnolia sinica]|uniref:alpha-ketoglutarate-dependent dioxygenase alkB isoform X2 n=1 Tax=Magnolia sinica TaxID=86752 RepID=UPI002659BE0A|nr:alpha-ketoglutarate-dependent dioxygenase alkB isoform X2 [Magnolia sinica]
MYGSTPQPSDSDRTAFRKAEKKYKLYKTTAPKSRRKQPSEVDLTEVYDFKSVLESFKQERKNPPGISELRCGLDRPVFCFEDRPGALSIEEQCHWVRESLTSFPQPSNRTNHNAIYGPIHDLFDAVQNKKVLVEVGSRIADTELGVHSSEGNLDACRWKFCEENVSIPKGDSCNSIAASVLLRKLRWSTLGLQFDWSKRNYDVSLPHNKIPDTLCHLAKKMAASAMPAGEEFQPEAAIVNYFGSGDMLGGHLDDMEADWSKPIVSISLGCKAIFLLGGKSREDTPVAMFLRSGDIVLMAGQARECFHGIPRIFTDEENAEVSPLASQFSSHEDLCFKEYIRTSRININIRQVH